MLGSATKEHAHELIDQMAPAQVSVIVELLEELLDPLAFKLANAPLDDEPTTEDDRSAIERSHSATVVSTEAMLASLHMTIDQFHQLATVAPGSTELAT